MAADLRVSQAALVILAVALSVQSLLLIAGAWLLVGAWNKAKSGERIASGLATVVSAPKLLLLTGATSKLLPRWRRKDKGEPTETAP